MKLVSIIIPVYNVEDYLKECIDSILEQDYRNIEIIIINDGSEDRSEEIIKKYMQYEKRIVYIKQKNKGLAQSRNVGIKYSKGEYLMFLDSDDFLEKNSVKKMINNIEESQSDICIGGYYKYFNEKKRIEFIPDVEIEKVMSNQLAIESILLNKIQCFACFKLYKKDILMEKKFEFEQKRLYEDFFPVFKILSQSRKISILKEPIYNYRVREGSITKSKNEKVIEDYYYAYENIIDYLESIQVKVNEQSLRSFRVQSYSYFIKIYINNQYFKNFRAEKYKKIQCSIKEVVFSKTRIRDKAVCILWNSGLGNITNLIEKKRKIITVGWKKYFFSQNRSLKWKK